MNSGSILEALGYIFIVMLFFGLPIAGLFYGLYVALRHGMPPTARGVASPPSEEQEQKTRKAG